MGLLDLFLSAIGKAGKPWEVDKPKDIPGAINNAADETANENSKK